MPTVFIIVNGERWSVPRGFGVAYKRAARAGGPTWDCLRDILELVGFTATKEQIEGWPLIRRVEAEVYAVSVHLRAGDNPTPVPPRPTWFPDPWCGRAPGTNPIRPTPIPAVRF
jgi:hypothetical protein